MPHDAAARDLQRNFSKGTCCHLLSLSLLKVFLSSWTAENLKVLAKYHPNYYIRRPVHTEQSNVLWWPFSFLPGFWIHGHVEASPWLGFRHPMGLQLDWDRGLWLCGRTSSGGQIKGWGLFATICSPMLHSLWSSSAPFVLCWGCVEQGLPKRTSIWKQRESACQWGERCGPRVELHISGHWSKHPQSSQHRFSNYGILSFRAYAPWFCLFAPRHHCWWSGCGRTSCRDHTHLSFTAASFIGGGLPNVFASHSAYWPHCMTKNLV